MNNALTLMCAVGLVGMFLESLLSIQGRKNFHKIVWGRQDKKAGTWARFTATYFLYSQGYGWKESWTRMKYPPNYI